MTHLSSSNVVALMAYRYKQDKICWRVTIFIKATRPFSAIKDHAISSLNRTF